MPLTENTRAYAASRFALVLDDDAFDKSGWLFSVEGGLAQAEVVSEKIGPENLIRKHLSAAKYEDISLTCGAAMSRSFFKWISSSFGSDYQRKNGAVIAIDNNFHEVMHLDFYQALVTEVGFPALDAASREMARLSVKLSPEYTRLSGKKNQPFDRPDATEERKAKRWLIRNFRCELYDQHGVKKIDCRRISKVEAITLKQKITEVPLGERREPYREPTIVEYPNVVFTLPESHADGFFNWYNSFVVKGRCSDDEEMNGSIEVLREDMEHVVYRIDLSHLGLFKITPDKGEAGSDRIRMVKVEMYCEQMKFQLTDSEP